MALTKEQLLEKRNDLSQFLFHLTRDGDLKLYRDIYSLQKDDVRPLVARASLLGILQSRRIEARSSFGYFNFKVKVTRNAQVLNAGSLVERDWLRAVCFTETPIDHVYLQMQEISGRQLSFKPYGLAYREDLVRKSNGNPVFYIQTTNQRLRHALNQMAQASNAPDFKDLMPLVEGFGAPWFTKHYGPTEIDFRWEREWRVVGDFSFSLSDVAFGLCPKSEKAYFEKIVGSSFPFIDPCDNILSIKHELRQWPHLKDLK